MISRDSIASDIRQTLNKIESTKQALLKKINDLVLKQEAENCLQQSIETLIFLSRSLESNTVTSPDILRNISDLLIKTNRYLEAFGKINFDKTEEAAKMLRIMLNAQGYAQLIKQIYAVVTKLSNPEIATDILGVTTVMQMQPVVTSTAPLEIKQINTQPTPTQQVIPVPTKPSQQEKVVKKNTPIQQNADSEDEEEILKPIKPQTAPKFSFGEKLWRNKFRILLGLLGIAGGVAFAIFTWGIGTLPLVLIAAGCGLGKGTLFGLMGGVVDDHCNSSDSPSTHYSERKIPTSVSIGKPSATHSTKQEQEWAPNKNLKTTGASKAGMYSKPSVTVTNGTITMTKVASHRPTLK